MGAPGPADRAGAALPLPPARGTPLQERAPRGQWRLAPLLGAFGLAIALATGVLVPAPETGPVALPALALPAGQSLGSVPWVSPSALPSLVPRGIVAERIVMPRLGIDLPIYQGDGFTARLGMAAHYPSTAWPGAGSLVYLYAHARDDNFLVLRKARLGDRIEIQLADGTTAAYQVARILPKVRWDDLSMLDPTPSEVLRLQTCTGYRPTDPRFIVEAIPAGPE